MILKKNDPQLLPTVISSFRRGFVVVYPTDTVYGIGTIATKDNDKNVKRIFSIKKRPLNKPLSILMTKDMLSQHIEAPTSVIETLKKIWPAQVTIILNWKQSSQNILSPFLNISKKRTLACRVPEHKFLLSILQELGVPIVGTSANVTGTPASFDFLKVSQNLASAQVDLWVNYGILPQRLPSTIVDMTTPMSPKVIRQGDFNFLENWKKHLTKSLN